MESRLIKASEILLVESYSVRGQIDKQENKSKYNLLMHTTKYDAKAGLDVRKVSKARK